MQQLSPDGERRIDELAQRHGFGREAVLSLLEAVARGNGTMAQFDHPEFGGSGQWMASGMIMVSDMFNDALKARVAALAAELAQLVVTSEPASAPVSLFVPPAADSSREWWPAALGTPTSHGAQDDVRYAYFAQARVLAIHLNGRLTLYNTLDHQIAGFSQQQSRGGSLSFHSQHGLIDLADLPVAG